MAGRIQAAAIVVGFGFGGLGLAHAADLSAPIKGPDGKPLGEAQVTAAPTGVLLRVTVSGVAPGWHALHFHAKGECSGPKFDSAGAHINHMPKQPHGLLNSGGPDFGDLPNLYVGADGSGHAEFFSSLVSLKPGRGDKPALLDADGSALVLHEHADDYTSQPIGGAGARIGCAVLR